MRSTIEDFHLWMQRYGNKRKVDGERIPAEPLSPRTSSRHLKKTRTILRDLGYLLYTKNPIPRRPNQWLVSPGKDFRFLSLEEIEGWFESHFPSGDRTPREKARWNDYAGAIRKFAEFMHYGKDVWSEEKLEKIRRGILLFDVAYPELEIVEPAKAHAFQRWLEAQPGYYVHGTMLYLMQWLGMRYLEVVSAKASLDGPTLKVDGSKSWVTIWGKGKRRVVKTTVNAAASGDRAKAEGLPPMAARPRHRLGGALHYDMGSSVERVVLGFQQDDPDSEPAAVQQVGGIPEPAGASVLRRRD